MRSSIPSSSRSGSSRPAEPLPLRLVWRPSTLLQTMLAVIGLWACIALPRLALDGMLFEIEAEAYAA